MMKPSPMPLSDKIEIAQIPAFQVPKVWPYVSDYIEKACGVSPDLTSNELFDRCNCFETQLWVVYSRNQETFHGAGITKLAQDEDQNLVCTIITYASDRKLNIRSWLHLVEEVESWARLERCKRIEIHGRKGWLRALRGYKLVKQLSDKQVILHKDL